MHVCQVTGIVLTLLATSIGISSKETGNGKEVILGARMFLQGEPSPPQISMFDLTECGPGICKLCTKKVGSYISDMRKKGLKAESVKKKAYEACRSFNVELALCQSFIDLNINTILYILKNKRNMTTDDICGVVYESCGCRKSNIARWKIDVDLGFKPTYADHTPSIKSTQRLTIVQITDIHYQPNYTPDGIADCKEPVCCRSVQKQEEVNNTGAGYWGDYRYCDLPWHTFDNALQHIKNTHKEIDYIYMTGDIVDHGIWYTSIEKNTKAIQTVLAKIKAEFPDIPVYPILGNHEASPLNVFAPTDINDGNASTNWLYELVAEEWSAWLPPETKETILQGGYYTVLVRPGLRIIGLNNNVCYSLNWWLILDSKYIATQLNWLAQTLLEAERNREIVHILTHIPSGDMCYSTWTDEYRKIIDRFELTIGAQFVGHTHNDELEIFYSLSDPSHAVNVAFNGGSLTHYDNRNSNYKVYTMNPESYEILDGETWIFNLTSANIHDSTYDPQWFKLFSYKEAYGMESLSPAHFNKLAHRLASDKSLLQKYARYYVKAADTTLHCDDKCLEDKLCKLVTTHAEETLQCNILKEEFRNAVKDKSPKHSSGDSTQR